MRCSVYYALWMNMPGNASPSASRVSSTPGVCPHAGRVVRPSWPAEEYPLQQPPRPYRPRLPGTFQRNDTLHRTGLAVGKRILREVGFACLHLTSKLGDKLLAKESFSGLCEALILMGTCRRHDPRRVEATGPAIAVNHNRWSRAHSPAYYRRTRSSECRMRMLRRFVAQTLVGRGRRGGVGRRVSLSAFRR
jgi:hypothetical protein